MCREEQCKPQECTEGIQCSCCGEWVCEEFAMTEDLCVDCYYGPCRSCGSELCFGNFTGICDEGSEVELNEHRKIA